MSLSFHCAGSPAHIVFGEGARQEVANWIAKISCRRALVLSTPQQKSDAEALAAKIGPLAVGVFSGAVMHTPVDVTETAMKLVGDSGADCVVSLGGGSTTSLGKAIAYRTNLPQIVIPTTYAGSEVTPIAWSNRGWSQDDGERCQDPARGGDLRCHADNGPSGRPVCYLGSERHGPCCRSALCAGPQPDLDPHGCRRLARLAGCTSGNHRDAE